MKSKAPQYVMTSRDWWAAGWLWLGAIVSTNAFLITLHFVRN